MKPRIYLETTVVSSGLVRDEVARGDPLRATDRLSLIDTLPSFAFVDTLHIALALKEL